MTDKTFLCPGCGGRGENAVHIRSSIPENSGIRLIVCDRCKGTGIVTADVIERIQAGERRRADRLARQVTLRGEAEKLGISPSELSNIENGRVG